MAHERTIARYRRWYRRLLGLYSRPHRERFAESMEQTFNDLCRERAKAGEGLLGFVLWTFVETSAEIIQENVRIILMQNLARRLVVWAAVIAILLLVPVWGNRYVDGWNWTLFDFVWAGAILFGAAVTFELIARHGGTTAYRAAVGIAVATGLVLVWVNAAVGIIGDGPANLMYFGVLAIGFSGASIARFQPHGMSRALVATSVAQALVPLVAMTWVSEDDFSPGYLQVLCLNAFFVALWIVSALLFRHAAAPWPDDRGELQGSGASREGFAD
jgi:hypothetical protein